MTHNLRIQIGPIEVVALTEVVAPFPVPLDQAFPTVSAEAWIAWREQFPSAFSDSNTWIRPVRCYLIRAPSRAILVDTGIGPAVTAWAQRAGASGSLLENLRLEQVAPGDIDTVLLTHLHPDHIGWNGTNEPTGWQQTFPYARYLMHQAEWDAGQQLLRANPAGASHLRENVLPLQEAGCLSFVAADTVLAEGVQALSTPGHTPGHLSVRVGSDGGAGVLLLGDAAVHPLQLADLNHVFSFDADAATARETRRRLLEDAMHSNLIVAACHFPEPGFGHLIAQGDGFRWQPV